MLRKTIRSFQMALDNIRSRLMHTFLSVLGIVIGVGALVAILSMIDGMEEYAKNQISMTTSLNVIIVRSNSTELVDGIRIKKDSVKYLKYGDFLSLQKDLSKPCDAYFEATDQQIITNLRTDSTHGALIRCVGVNLGRPDTVGVGQGFEAKDLAMGKPIAVINHLLAKKVSIDSNEVAKAIGSKIMLGNQELTVVGVLKENPKNKMLEVRVPITIFEEPFWQKHLPRAALRAVSVEDVEQLKAETKSWLEKNFPEHHGDFSIGTNDFRLKQTMQGFLIFRLVMSMIVGISVIVGGIGVMNVLLISVTERTSEIGVRKALGANRKDITLQFLAEAVTVSVFGSILGLLLGIGFTLVAVPVIKMVADVQFHAAYTSGMLLTVGTIAILVGVVFGTYPALRASRLDPVEAIRRE